MDNWLRGVHRGGMCAAGAGGRTAGSTARRPATWRCACRSTWSGTWTSCWCAGVLHAPYVFYQHKPAHMAVPVLAARCPAPVVGTTGVTCRRVVAPLPV